MANRCYWLSCSEAAIYLLIGGDRLQTPNHQRPFTRQLHWAMHGCKRALNGETTGDTGGSCFDTIGTVAVDLAPRAAPGAAQASVALCAVRPGAASGAASLEGTAAGRSDATGIAAEPVVTSAGGLRPAVCQLGNGAIDSAADASLLSGASEPNVGGTPGDVSSDEEMLDSDQGADEEDGDDRDATTEAAGGGGGEGVEGATELIALTASIGSTNSADDFAHRGGALRDMLHYIYRMYVRREPRGRRKARSGGTIFEFAERYPLSTACIQRVRLDRMDVPTIDGSQCPTWSGDPEQN